MELVTTLNGAVLFRFVLLAALSGLSASQGSWVARDSQELWAALQSNDVTVVQLEGTIKLDPNWKTVLLGRDLLIYGEDREKTILDFNGVSEAIVLQDSVELEFRTVHTRGFPSMPTLTVAEYSRYRAYSQYSWPSIVTLNGTTIFHNQSWIESAYLYSPDFYAKQSAIFGLTNIYQQLDSRTFVFHGLHTLPSVLTDQLLEVDVGVVTIIINEVKVTSALTAPEVSSEGSESVTGCSNMNLIIGWQTVLIALALTVSILLLLALVVFIFKRPLLAWVRNYDKHIDDAEQPHPKLVFQH